MNIEFITRYPQMIQRWYIAILLYLLLVCIIMALRPKMLFLENKTYKKWSLYQSRDCSIFSIAILFPIMAFISFYLSALYIVIIS